MHRAPRLGALDKAGADQHVEMLHHRRQRHGERLGNRAHRQAVLAREPLENCSPGRIGERCEGAIEMGFRIVNHQVKYGPRPPRLSIAQRRPHGQLKARGAAKAARLGSVYLECSLRRMMQHAL